MLRKLTKPSTSSPWVDPRPCRAGVGHRRALLPPLPSTRHLAHFRPASRRYGLIGLDSRDAGTPTTKEIETEPSPRLAASAQAGATVATAKSDGRKGGHREGGGFPTSSTMASSDLRSSAPPVGRRRAGGPAASGKEVRCHGESLGLGEGRRPVRVQTFLPQRPSQRIRGATLSDKGRGGVDGGLVVVPTGGQWRWGGVEHPWWRWTVQPALCRVRVSRWRGQLEAKPQFPGRGRGGNR